MIRGLDQLLHEVTHLKVNVADDPLTAVARGAGMVIEHADFFRSVFIA